MSRLETVKLITTPIHNVDEAEDAVVPATSLFMNMSSRLTLHHHRHFPGEVEQQMLVAEVIASMVSRMHLIIVPAL
jgi:hypothetical protein